MRKTEWEQLQNELQQQQLLQLQQKVPTFNALPLHSQNLIGYLSIIYYPGVHFEGDKKPKGVFIQGFLYQGFFI